MLILYLTRTKNYAKADDIKVFGSHSYESELRYLHISKIIQICNKLFKFFKRN